MRRLPLFLFTALIAVSSTLTEGAVTYVDSTKVNLLRRVDGTGAFAVQTGWNHTWGTVTGSTTATDLSYLAVNASIHDYTYVLAAALPDPTVATASFDITLPSTVTMNQLQIHPQSYSAAQYQVWLSSTGFGSMTSPQAGLQPLLVSTWNTVNFGSTAVRYVRIEFKGANTGNGARMSIGEIAAFGPAGQTIALNDGYSLMAQLPANGGPGPIPAGAPYQLNFSNLGNAIDRDMSSYAAPSASTAYFVIPLNDSYTLAGAGFGSRHGNWPNILIEYTNDTSISASTVWQTAFQQATTFYPETVAFASPVQARFVRVTKTGTSTNAVAEFELFALVPEPASLSLLTLGGLALLRRRRK